MGSPGTVWLNSLLRVSVNQNQGVARAAVFIWSLGSFSKRTSHNCRIKGPIFLLAFGPGTTLSFQRLCSSWHVAPQRYVLSSRLPQCVSLPSSSVTSQLTETLCFSKASLIRPGLSKEMSSWEFQRTHRVHPLTGAQIIQRCRSLQAILELYLPHYLLKKTIRYGFLWMFIVITTKKR